MTTATQTTCIFVHVDGSVDQRRTLFGDLPAIRFARSHPVRATVQHGPPDRIEDDYLEYRRQALTMPDGRPIYARGFVAKEVVADAVVAKATTDIDFADSYLRHFVRTYVDREHRGWVLLDERYGDAVRPGEASKFKSMHLTRREVRLLIAVRTN